MFELQRLAGPNRRPIALATRLGNTIDNTVGAPVTAQAVRRYDELVDKLKRHGSRIELRRAPAGEYNCYGHVWASRRTAIYDDHGDAIVKMIREDDGYRITTKPQPDDIAVYADRHRGVVHVARVVQLCEGVTADSPKIPRVVSKWCDWGGETAHDVRAFPLIDDSASVSVEYWTDRPRSKEPLHVS